MTTERKLLTAAGAIVIVGLLLIAAFALGVYVGEHGWTRAGLALQGPSAGAPRPLPGAPGVPGTFSPLPGGGRPDLVGRIRGVLVGTLMLATPDGPRTIELDERARVETPGGELRSLDDLERGQRVAVFGRRNGDGQVLVGELIVLLPPRQQPPADPDGQSPLPPP